MNTFRKALHYLWLHAWKYHVIERQHRKYVAKLRERETVRVVFTAIDVSLWRYQHLYELMAADDRFSVSIVLTPCTSREHMDNDVAGLRRYFDHRGISYVDFDAAKPFDIKAELNPDIIFYTQPYEYLLSPQHDCRRFYDRLVCYIPYAFWTASGKLSYDLHFHNLAWRLYYSTAMHLKDAQAMATNKGRNVRVVGYPNADEFMKEPLDVWKPQERRKKRIIWAPHFTIWGDGWSQNSNFLWMADLMLDIADTYKDEIQFAFKPHPRLITELYKHPDWGKKKADCYYERWKELENGQIESGLFFNLFMTSDAMIHDSGSFAVEYFYTGNPVMFMNNDMTPLLNESNDFGKMIYNLHYVGKNEGDIKHFIQDIVIEGHDPLKDERLNVKNRYLLPPNDKTVAENTMDDLNNSLNTQKI